MNVIVFGASGGTGQEVVRQALAAGHTVTAFVRNPATYSSPDQRVQVVKGDVKDPASIEAALSGQDAVISVIGAKPTKTSTIRTEGTKAIITAMEKVGPKRLISQSTMGAGDSKPMLSWLYAFILVPLLLKGTFADHDGQEQVIQASSLDWTIIRAGALNNKPLTGKYRILPVSNKRQTLKLSRADAAHFIVHELENNAYVKQIAGVAY